MNSIEVDVCRLKTDIHEVEAALRAAKRRVRVRQPRPEAYGELFELKGRATLLYAIRAHARGRLHMTKVIRSHGHLGLPPRETFSLEDQAKWIGERWKAFRAEAA